MAASLSGLPESVMELVFEHLEPACLWQIRTVNKDFAAHTRRCLKDRLGAILDHVRPRLVLRWCCCYSLDSYEVFVERVHKTRDGVIVDFETGWSHAFRQKLHSRKLHVHLDGHCWVNFRSRRFECLLPVMKAVP